MTTESLHGAVEDLEGKRQELEDRLEMMRKGGVKPLTKDERDKAEERFRYWGRKSAARKRGFEELEGMFLAGMTKEALYVSSN